MGLSGDPYERQVTVGNATGRLFAGTLGDGAVNATGNANAATWPGAGATGTGWRGGNWFSGATALRVSDRYAAALHASERGSTRGGRGCRLVP